MESLITFAESASPLALLGLMIVGTFYAIYKLSKGELIIKSGKQTIDDVRTTQLEKYPQLQEMIFAMQRLEGQNTTLLENHFKHEIPEMRDDIKSIKETVNFIKDNHGNRLTRLETIIEK